MVVYENGGGDEMRMNMKMCDFPESVSALLNKIRIPTHIHNNTFKKTV